MSEVVGFGGFFFVVAVVRFRLGIGMLVVIWRVLDSACFDFSEWLVVTIGTMGCVLQMEPFGYH